jgi:hypothetical protein
MAFLTLTAGHAAIAQSANRTGAANSSSEKQGPWLAPTGHRQPRTEQVPAENGSNNSNDAIAREDAALDKKIKSICRGC